MKNISFTEDFYIDKTEVDLKWEIKKHFLLKVRERDASGQQFFINEFPTELVQFIKNPFP